MKFRNQDHQALNDVRKLAHDAKARHDLLTFRALQEEKGVKSKIRPSMEVRHFRKGLNSLSSRPAISERATQRAIDQDLELSEHNLGVAVCQKKLTYKHTTAAGKLLSFDL